MAPHLATLALLTQEAEQSQLSLPDLAQRLLPPPPADAHTHPDDPVTGMLHFAAEHQLTLGEDLRLRDLL